MTTIRQQTGNIGQDFVIKQVICPICKKDKFALLGPKNFPAADIACKFCGQLAQVKSYKTNDVNRIPKNISGAAWRPFINRIRAGIFLSIICCTLGNEDK